MRLRDLGGAFDRFDVATADVDDFRAVKQVAFGGDDFAFDVAPAEFGARSRPQNCVFLADSHAVGIATRRECFLTNRGRDGFGLQKSFVLIGDEDCLGHELAELVDGDQDEPFAFDTRGGEDRVAVCRGVTHPDAKLILLATLLDNHVDIEDVVIASNDAFGQRRWVFLNFAGESIDDEITDVALTVIVKRALRIGDASSVVGILPAVDHKYGWCLRHDGVLLNRCFRAAESNDRSQGEENPSHVLLLRADRGCGPIFGE